MQAEDHPLVIAAGSDLTRQIAFGGNAFNLNGVNDCRKLLVEAGIDFGLFFVTPNYFRQSVRLPRPTGKLLFNLISDADQNRKVLGVLERILLDPSIQAINHPATVMTTTRDQVSNRLRDIPGLVVPGTLRLSAAHARQVRDRVARGGFRFPAILRPIGTHGGEGARVVPDLDAALAHPAAARECYLTEFVDYRSADGYFRKCRCFFIGDEIVFRHLIISDHWSVHAADRKRLMLKTGWMTEEEAAMHDVSIGHFTAGQIEAMKAIRARMGLDYFGLDFSVLASGELLLFEANATMNFFPFSTPDRSHYSWKCLPITTAAVRKLVESRLAAPRR